VTRLLLLALLLLVIAWAFWRLVDGIIETFGGKPSRTRKRGAPAVKLARDPVCGTWVAPANARALQDGSTIHYFCSDRCLSEYRSRR
jgi:YHS domain-containing protein